MLPRLAALLAAISVVLLASAATSMAAVTSFGGPGPGASVFLGAAVAPDGTVYVADSTQDRVEHYTGEGTYIDDLGRGVTTFDSPTDVAIASDGSILVADDDHRLIQKFSAAGTYLAQWPVTYAPTQPGVADLAIGSDGTVYVADYRLDRIRRYTMDGTELGGVGLSWIAAGPVLDADGCRRRARRDGLCRRYVEQPGPALHGVGRVPRHRRQRVAPTQGRRRRRRGRPAGRGLRSQRCRAALTHGVERGRFAFPHAPQSVSPTPSGLVYVTVSQMDANVSDRVYRLDTRTPLARLTASAAEVSTGEPVVFDAGGSEPPLGSVARYEWDFDGDGSFETDSGATPTASATYSRPGVVEPAVRVTSAAAVTAVATSRVLVHLASPAGPVGVSIDAGAAFTNSPVVDLTLRWPQFTDLVSMANDGGFSNAVVAPVAGHVSWTLDSTGPERLPKIIYVRFGQATQTFQDDIILDQTPPTITQATEEGTDTPAEETRAVFAAATSSDVSLLVDDDVSGIRKAQFAVNRSAPATAVRFAEHLVVAGSPRWVRVQDGAGNWSTWRALAKPGAAPRLTISTPRLSRLARGVKLNVACAEACKIKLKLAISRRDARRLHLKSTTIATGRGTRSSAGVIHLRPRPQGAVARRLAKVSKLRISVTATVTTAGGSTTVSRTATFKH